MLNAAREYCLAKGIEVIKFIESWDMNFYQGNIIKYTTRAGYKSRDTAIEDLKKARNYIDFEIGRLQNGD